MENTLQIQRFGDLAFGIQRVGQVDCSCCWSSPIFLVFFLA